MDKHGIINLLDLSPHIEGGYFKQTYRSPIPVMTDSSADINRKCLSQEACSRRNLLTSIYYMLTDDSPIGYLHKNSSDIIHYFHAGSALKYILLSPEGKLEEKILGPDLEKGQQLQLIVAAGCWKATELIEGEYGLISEAVTPGFEYTDMQMANEAMIKEMFNSKFNEIKKYIK